MPHSCIPVSYTHLGKPFTKRIVHRPRVEGAEPELHVRLRGQQLLQQLGERHLRLEEMCIRDRLCTQGYSGKGYSTEFVQNMSAIVHSLRNVPGTRIRLVFGSDSLCAHCPHHTADDLCESQEKVSRFDRKTVEYFDLHEGEYVYQDLIRAIDAQMTPAMLEDICRGCAWYPVSACKKNICGK